MKKEKQPPTPPAHILQVWEDYKCFRDHEADPIIASVLCIASAIHRFSSVRKTAQNFNEILSDPSILVGFIRQYGMIEENLKRSDQDKQDPESPIETLLERSRRNK